jgi:hypothetical protein
MQPFCNLITLTVTQVGGIYRLEGYDNLCGDPRRASVTGNAFPNPNTTIGLGLTIIGLGGSPLHLDATVSAATGYSGTWRDDLGREGAFVLTTGPGTGGQVRTTSPPTQGFVVTATDGPTGNMAGGCVRLTHPLLENVPTAVLAVTHQWTETNLYLTSDFSVRLDDSRWYICPATIPAIQAGHKFHVIVMR